MSIIAKWKSKTWEVSPQRVIDLTGLSFGYELNAEDNDEVEGATLSNQRGLKKMPLAFVSTFNSALGVDVRKEISSWRDLIGQSGTFYLNGKKLGYFLLKSVTPGDIVIDNAGRMRSAKVAFAFEEADKATGTTGGSGVTASEADKAARKSDSGAGSGDKETFKKGTVVRENGVDGNKVIHTIYNGKALIGTPTVGNKWVNTLSLSIQ